jgi:hypothetical protein
MARQLEKQWQKLDQIFKNKHGGTASRVATIEEIASKPSEAATSTAASFGIGIRKRKNRTARNSYYGNGDWVREH